MAEYIEREALKQSIKNSDMWNREKISALTVVSLEPAADVAPVVHGRWDGTADGYWDGELVYDIWNCSECGFDADGADEKPEWKYCPNCGAKMKGE